MFNAILADPPWSYANWTDAKNGAAVSSMTTMDTAGISSIPVADWSSPTGCFLFLWATLPKLPEAFQVGEAWGFEYVTAVPWVKLSAAGEIKSGVGFWCRQCAELLTIWRRGDPKASRDRTKTPVGLLEDAANGGAVFYSPKASKHSSKPLALYDWIESLIPGPYLELFAREKRHGWTAYGLDLGFELGPWGVRKTQ